jgi:hypothetical protein
MYIFVLMMGRTIACQLEIKILEPIETKGFEDHVRRASLKIWIFGL